jgi:eukaryotic-like serine/threonine-protein kinase
MSAPRPESPDTGFSLSPGDRLGPYEILGPLGVGGMGEVYRARDPRLGREVAVKILHRSLAITPEHSQRLAREARAAASLNHPNIVAVFDVGTEGSLPYIVSELLKGEPLRSRLDRGPLPYRKALEYGIQIADALGAAHEKGIWHRDVKPGNAFITPGGRLKLLDFGLVKVGRKREKAGPEDPTADDTRPGAVLGTPGYMSPEQLLGEEVDHRTDIFSLGAVLYEMFAGAPAFRRHSGVDTQRALLTEDPADLLERNGKLPPTAVAVVRRCLERNKEQRFQSVRDLAFQLQQLHSEAERAAPPLARYLAVRHLALAAALGLALLGGTVWLVYRASRPPPAPGFEQISFRRGRIGGARFASEGGDVVYSEAREGKPLEVWLRGPGSPESRHLGHEGSDVLAVRGGKVALSLGRRFVFGERFVGTLAEAPTIGEGSPHELADNVEDADWDPSGRQLVVVRSPGVEGESRLEYPLGHELYKSSGSIRSPRFSPDGRRIAFLEDPTARGSGGRVAVVDLEGKLTPLTENEASARGLAWSSTGDEIWFAAGASRTNRALRAVNLKGRHRLILQTAASLTLWDVALDGRVLLTRDEERSALVGTPPGETAERDLSWFDNSGLADLSEDGANLLFNDRFGVYICRTDGSPPRLLGLSGGFGDAFSPDGTKVLATAASGDELVILPAGPGEPLSLPAHGIAGYRGALWFPDGQRVLFNGAQSGGTLRAYIQDVEGGPPRPFADEKTRVLAISPDGQWGAAIGPGSDKSLPRQGIWLWPVAGGKPRAVPSSQERDRPVAWSEDRRWLWVFRRGQVPAEVSQVEIDTGRRRLWKTLKLPDPSGVYSINDFKVTRDGRAYFYSYRRVISQLYTASGLR